MKNLMRTKNIMNRNLILVAVGLAMSMGCLSAAVEDAPPAEVKKTASSIDRAELEKRFQAVMTGAVFRGQWSLIENGEVGESKPDSYQIQKVSKVSEDVWLIHARIKFGKTDVVLPVPVHVNWAGDTPVIAVTDVGFPGIGTYTARVVVYDNLYAGTWTGAGYGGVMSGVIVRGKSTTKE